ncbi:MAG: hypothetical protein IKR40_05855 [Treponema sp.]|nr:hypothetical protein [Treponema sp.]
MEIKKIVVLVVLGIPFLGLIAGCDIISETECVRMDFSSVDLTPDSWYVSCCDGESEQVHVQDGSVKCLELELPKNCPAGILVYPVEDSVRGKPLGALYPFQDEISVAGGFVAYIADRLYRGAENDAESSRDYIARFNWPRFIEVCSEAEDPWRLDCERIVSAIASGSFKKSDVKVR